MTYTSGDILHMIDEEWHEFEKARHCDPDVLYISRNLVEIFGLDDLIEHVWSEKIVTEEYDDWIAFGGITK